MFDWVRARVLRFMRVPVEPEPPLGAPGSVRVFRAGRNYYKLRLLRWSLTQFGAAAGIAFSLMFIDYLEEEVNAVRASRTRAAQHQAAAATAPVLPPAPDRVAPATQDNLLKRAASRKPQRDGRQEMVQRLAHWPQWIFPLMHLVEYGALLLFFVQIPFSYAAVRLEFEQHWYLVTDRSLRIRTGLLRMQESTMSFANLQQVEMKQGPLQRLLGLADVHVQSAGGGGDEAKPGHDDSLHTGIFHCVDNAPEIRDLILARLRHFRQAGLGDPDDHHQHASATAALAQSDDTLAAARELLAEARALRAALS